MKKIFYLFTLSSMILVSCHADLDQVPTDPDLFTEIDVFKDTDSAKGALAKIYASLAITGQVGPDGNPDIDPSLIDEGFSQYTRILYTLNVCSTDEAVVGWGDPGKGFNLFPGVQAWCDESSKIWVGNFCITSQ